ncbi:Transmembrane_domain-containing protein [Hexamita inflata]|uniref:Transmembrane domain-containing protein n=1 Tax=Hexamita inflata TaxID=28002 RepID=A0AA86TZ47_9EUKA|nr:Transmembrane domain-containing protein [Hexamita inflata]CAI9925990.1 Transmembrane domain-containing protein [Hexamita inflata]CAI9933911.1 Transmembrane domain-containing protein [Hexamita inflata]
MNLIPIFMVIVFTIAIMFFYHQFTVIYVFFRQRCLKRVIPQNYMVLLQNLPSVIDSKEEVLRLIKPINQGVRTIVPVPKRTNELNSIYEDITSLNIKLDKIKRAIQTANAQHSLYSAMFKAVKQDSDIQQKKKERLLQKYDTKKVLAQDEAKKQIKNFASIVYKLKKARFELLKIAYEDNVHKGYIYLLEELPPRLPDLIMPNLDMLPTRERMERVTEFDYQTPIKSMDKRSMDKMLVDSMFMFNKQNPKVTLGSSAFLFCDSQSLAAEKYTALISNNSKRPEVLLAPNPHEIIWKNIAISNGRKSYRKFWFVIYTIILFLAYIYGQAKIMGLIQTNEGTWNQDFFKSLCPATCIYGTDQGGICSLCGNFSSMLITMIPTMFTCIFMGFLPQFIKLLVKLLNYPSISHNVDRIYQILFVFLIIIMGILQVALPEMIDVKTGAFDISFLQNFNMNTLVDNLGKNVVNQQFTFINYIINQYFTFPVFGLLNIYGMIMWVIAKFQKNKLDYNITLRFLTFNFAKQLAYTSHMLVVGLIFAIVAPVTSVIVFITYTMMAVTDRYFILYVNVPTVTADLSAQSNMLVNVIGAIFVGLVFMLVSTACNFFIQEGAIYTFGLVVCIVCLVVSVVYKNVIDSQYKRSLSELARGDFQESDQIQINPAHIDNPYSDQDDYESRYNLNNQVDKVTLNKLLKKPESYEYKMNPLDLLLRKVYVDLINLPVSVLKIDDIEIGEQRCVLLTQEEQISNQLIDQSKEQVYQEIMNSSQTNKRTVGRSFEEINIMAYYTHPALNYLAISE